MICRRKIFARTVSLLAAAMLLFAVFVYVPKSKQAQASHCHSPTWPCCAFVVTPLHLQTRQMITEWHDWIRLVVFGTAGTEFTTGTARLGEHEVFLLDEIFFNRILPAMMMMTEQFTTLIAQQTLMIGTFFDAKQQLETQALYQKLSARAHKDYHPSFGMCTIGTNMRSIAAAEYNSDFTRLTMNERYLDRQLGNEHSVAGGNPGEDRMSMNANPVPTAYNRLGYFLNNTCDPNDLNKIPGRPDTGMTPLCAGTVLTGWANRDIDFSHTVMAPRTINVDFKDNTASDNSRVLEMSNYLYGHVTRSRIETGALRRQQNQSKLQSDRSITAKRNVAQNSFGAIVGLKSRGTRDGDPPSNRNGFSSEDTSEYMHFLLQQLGISATQQEYWDYMSQKNPSDFPNAGDQQRNEMSYYAQMEILAKRIYQRPEFYTNLYDKPANVKRKGAALQAIGLMLERDIYDSYLRSEAIMSLILEARLMREQHRIENFLEQLTEVSK